MPPVNPVLVSAGVVAISMAIVAAIAVYENPELRRIADDFRRRVAVAAQAFHDDIFANNSEQQRDRQREDQESEPVFNRPEDAEGFLMSSGRRSAGDPGVVADEASRRRQREELMYWNTIREAKAEAARKLAQVQTTSSDVQQHKALFDEIMREDYIADHATTVINTGANVSQTTSDGDPLNGGMMRRRRLEGVRSGLRAASVYSNPFGDEYGIDPGEFNDQPIQSFRRDRSPTAAEAFDSRSAYLVTPDRDETISDIYSATEPDTSSGTNRNAMDAVFDPLPAISESAQATPSLAASSEPFFDVRDYRHQEHNASPATLADSYSKLSLQLARQAEIADEGSDIARSSVRPNEAVQSQAYDTIQAWAEAQADAQADAQSSDNGAALTRTTTSSSPSTLGFYSPLPITPSVAMSEPSHVSSSSSSSEAGEPTPTGSVFVDDHSFIDHADAVSSRSVTQGSFTGSAADSAILLEQASAVSDYGVVSESEDEGHNAAIMTPTSWSDVGSVVSENEEGPVRL
ncbi:hypothetical protein SEPCBS57363_005039 [Sporothrix epigloea]|uniref:Uncharacterized protein n=1 Tax=Sporothrix epigloea TaxID=1892477 RepID=A0ABP0DVA8_9PEZI